MKSGIYRKMSIQLKPSKTLDELMSKSLARIDTTNIDEHSTFSYIFITSIKYKDSDELKECLKNEFLRINSKKQKKSQTFLIDKFRQAVQFIHKKKIKDIELEQETNISIPSTPHEKSEQEKIEYILNRNLFLKSVFIGFLSTLIQMTFLILLTKNYYKMNIQKTDDPEKISMRIVTVFGMSVLVWIEYRNGKVKFNHGLFQGFFYVNIKRRLITIIFSLIQMISGLLCLVSCTMLIAQNASVVENAKSFGAIIMLVNIDDWAGEYFLNSNKRMKVYLGGSLECIWCYDKERRMCLRLVNFIELILFFSVEALAMSWVYKSIGR